MIFSNLYRSMGDLESSGAFLSTQNGLALSLRARDFIWIASLGVRTLVQPAEADNVTTFGWFCDFFERYLTIHFEKADFYSEDWDINFVPWSARPSRVIFSTSSLEGTDFMLTPKKSQLEVFVELVCVQNPDSEAKRGTPHGDLCQAA